MREEIDPHVKGEKPGEGFFSQTRATGVDMVELRDRLLACKQELPAQAEAAGCRRSSWPRSLS